MDKVVKLHQWLGDKLSHRVEDAKTAKRFRHYHQLRIFEAEVMSKTVTDRKCPHRT